MEAILLALLSPCPILSLVLLVFLTFMFLESTFKHLLQHRQTLALAAHRTRQIEAMARLDDEARERLLEALPDWADKDDPDLEAWEKALKETNLLTGEDE
jgi:hypothetical protein